MTEQDDVAETRPPQAHRGGARIKAIYIAAAVLGAAMIGAFASSSFSQGFGGFGPGFGYGTRSNLRDVPFGAFDPAQMSDRADRMIRHLAIEIDATTEQQQKLSAIITAAIKDLAPVPDNMLAFRRQGRDLLTQQTIDRAALEKLRADQIATVDAASKRLVQALADAAEVLTPEQRRKLSDMLPPRGGPGEWNHGPAPGWGMRGFWHH